MSLNQAEVKLSSESGVLTVFSLLVLSGFFLMFLVIFNYYLYVLGSQRLEESLEISLNSVLSCYDGDAMRELGLFVLPESDQLAELGESYFVRNLMADDVLKVNLLEYTLVYLPEDSFYIKANLEEQILQQETYDGWLGLGSALFDFLGLHDLPTDLSMYDDAGAEAAGVAEATGFAEAAGVAETAGAVLGSDWLMLLEEILNIAEETASGESQVSLWQLLSPWPQAYHNNVRLPDLAYTQSTQEEEIEEQLTKIFGNFSGFLQYADYIKGKIKETVAAEKNKILRSEYVLQQWDYATAKAMRSRYFEKAEVEYILGGHKESWDNIRYTAFSIFLLRTMLHGAYNFINSPVSSLSLRLAEAVLEGMTESKKEVEELFAGRKVAAFPGQTRLQMSYKDHLRLFLIMQPQEQQLQRLQDLLRVNLGYWQHTSKNATVAATSAASTAANAVGLADLMPQHYAWLPADLTHYYRGIQARAVVELELWPIGNLQLERVGALGYDVPFRLVEPA
jgi:hypothetical protein